MVYVDVRIESPTQTAHLSRRCSTVGRRWPCERTSRSTYARMSFTSELTVLATLTMRWMESRRAIMRTNVPSRGAKSKNARRRCGSSLPLP